MALSLTVLATYFSSLFSFKPEAIGIHTASEFSMAVAFYLIMVGLLYFFHKRRDLGFPGHWLLPVFFFLSGTLHMIRLTAAWLPVYSYEAAIKSLAAILGLVAALLTRRFLTRALEYPHPNTIKETQEKCDAKIAQYKEKEAVLQKTHQKLEAAYEEKVQELNQSRNLYRLEQTQTEKEISLLPTLIQTLSKTELPDALSVAANSICEMFDWDCAETWLIAENGKVLEYGSEWCGDARFEELRRVSQDLRFPPEMDLAGRVWAAQKPILIPNLAVEPNGTFMRAQVCQKLGIKSALGVPIYRQGKVWAILVFMMTKFREQDKRRVGLVSAAAGLLSCVLEEKVVENTLMEVYDQHEKKVRERTKELLKAQEVLEAQIAEYKRTEEALRGSQENFSSLLNSVDGIIWEYDMKTKRFTFVSEQASRILGYPIEAWFADPSFWQDHIHGGDRALALAFRARVAEEKRDDRFEYRMITAEGQTVWMRDMVTVMVDRGETVKLRGVMFNITEPKQVQEALNQERNFVSAIFETAGALVMVLDTEGRIVRFNRACEQISGYLAEEAKGRFFWDLFSNPQEEKKAKLIFTRLLAGQFPINDESYWVAKDGTRRAIAWSNTVLLNKYGAVIHVIATGVDITKRKEVEQMLKEAVSDLARSNQELDRSSHEIKEANQQLRELDEIKSHFISAASHELRTPLTSIKGYVETILEDEVGPLNEKQREFLTYVKTSTDRLHRLLNELLDISKIESGQVQMNKELTDLRSLLREEMMIFKAQAHQKNISIDMDSDAHLREIYCDGDKIRELMDNLINNAIKYTLPGGKVKIEARNHDTGVKIDVRDNGIGIHKEDLNRVFEPFQHIEKNGMETTEESTGLGLTLVKRIVEAHEGDVTVKSQEGKGSVFSVTLPLGSRSENSKNSWALRPAHE